MCAELYEPVWNADPSQRKRDTTQQDCDTRFFHSLLQIDVLRIVLSLQFVYIPLTSGRSQRHRNSGQQQLHPEFHICTSPLWNAFHSAAQGLLPSHGKLRPFHEENPDLDARVKMPDFNSLTWCVRLMVIALTHLPYLVQARAVSVQISASDGSPALEKKWDSSVTFVSAIPSTAIPPDLPRHTDVRNIKTLTCEGNLPPNDYPYPYSAEFFRDLNHLCGHGKVGCRCSEGGQRVCQAIYPYDDEELFYRFAGDCSQKCRCSKGVASLPGGRDFPPRAPWTPVVPWNTLDPNQENAVGRLPEDIPSANPAPSRGSRWANLRPPGVGMANPAGDGSGSPLRLPSQKWVSSNASTPSDVTASDPSRPSNSMPTFVDRAE